MNPQPQSYRHPRLLPRPHRLAAGPRLLWDGSWEVLRAGRPGLDRADEDALATDLVSGGLEADDAVAPALGQVQGTGPGVHGAEPVAPSDQVLNVDKAPHQVGGQASEP